MKLKKKIIITICLISMLSVGCSTKSTESHKNISMKNIENHIPYVDKNNGKIDNAIINKRYEIVKKEELTYNPKEYHLTEEEKKMIRPEYLDDVINNNLSYKNILLGFTYSSEINPCNLAYDDAIKLIKKVLPDDIKQVDLKVDEEVNKEYIYYKSSKGDFKVGLCYSYEFNDENLEVVNKDRICGIDYSKETK